MKSPDQHRISGNIKSVRDNRDGHRKTCIPLRPINRWAGIIKSYKRKWKRRVKEINPCRLHNIRFHAAENQPEQRSPRQQAYRHHRRRDTCYYEYQLPGRFFCIFLIPLPDILRADDGAACCQRIKCLYHQDIDGVHQRYSRDCCRSHIADHNAIRCSHQRIQELFHYKRNQKHP